MNRASAMLTVLIVLTLVGMGTIHVQNMRAVANQTVCINNLKNIGLSCHDYHGQHGHLPRAILAHPTENDSPSRQTSWIFGISHTLVGHMDPKWFIKDPKKPWDHANNAYVIQHHHLRHVISCPANEQADENRSTHYIAITGVGKDAACLPAGHRDSGLFGYDRVTKLGDITRGAENVIMLAETANLHGHWLQGGFSTSRGLDQNGAAYLGMDGQFNGMHGRRLLIPAAFTTNVLMADASVRSFTDSTSDAVLESLVRVANNP